MAYHCAVDLDHRAEVLFAKFQLLRSFSPPPFPLWKEVPVGQATPRGKVMLPLLAGRAST